MWLGKITKVRYNESEVSDFSVKWGGNADPRGMLEDGKEYDVKEHRIHSSHQKIILVDFPDKKFGRNGFDFVEGVEFSRDNPESFSLSGMLA
jgi:hypothetical protein